MTLTLVASGRDFAVVSDGWRIPRRDVQPLADATDLLTAANARAAAIEGMAAEAQASGWREGRDAGVREGRAAGAAEAARALAALVVEVRRVQADQRETLGQLSLEVVRRIAADLGPQAMLEAVVERAVREVLADQPLVVHVAPAAEEGVSRRLASLAGQLEVVADAGIAEDQCLIVTPRGSARSGLELQLSVLERAFADMAEGSA